VTPKALTFSINSTVLVETHTHTYTYTHTHARTHSHTHIPVHSAAPLRVLLPHVDSPDKRCHIVKNWYYSFETGTKTDLRNHEILCEGERSTCCEQCCENVPMVSHCDRETLTVTDPLLVSLLPDDRKGGRQKSSCRKKRWGREC
jgi:hypothetical protein